MMVKDKKINIFVDVYETGCPGKSCYWPRQNPGTFVQGRGYSGGTKDWLCGTRELRGCPDQVHSPGADSKIGEPKC